MSNYDVVPLRHQQQLLELPWAEPSLEVVFMIAGYSAGKSFSLVLFMIALSQRYNGSSMVCGFGSPTISFARKTVIADLERTLIGASVPYRFNSQTNEFTIGTVKWIIFPLDNPKLIFGWNFSVTITDENDELEQGKCIEGFGAVQERTRISLPDGRKPFSIVVSTAQGLKGLYRITENLKEKGIPYAIIHGRTQDNTNLTKDYYNRLYALYTDLERLVFLEGGFANLTSGRVYPQFDETICTVPDFDIDAGETVSIGQDMNNQASCAVGVVKKDKILYIVKDFCFKDFTMSAAEIRREYPTQRIPYYPDASGKMIIQGQMAEFSQHDFEVMQANSNPPISERIFLVNKLLMTGRLKICKSVNNLAMAWKTRCYAPNGEPEKASRHPEPSDYCDSSEYVIWRIVSNDPDFYDLYSLLRSHKNS